MRKTFKICDLLLLIFLFQLGDNQDPFDEPWYILQSDAEDQKSEGRPDFVSFSSNILSLQWNFKPSIEVEMRSFSNCMFDGVFEDDPYSKVLLSLIRCSNTSVILQIHSEKLGDMLISIENGRPVLDEQEVVSRNTRSVTNGTKKKDMMTF